jgi:hypothetical protein
MPEAPQRIIWKGTPATLGTTESNPRDFTGNRRCGGTRRSVAGMESKSVNLTGDFCPLGNHNCSRHAPVIKENGFESILVIAGVHQDQEAL